MSTSDYTNPVSGFYSLYDVLAARATAGDPIGQVEYITPGSYSWTVPDGVTSVCVVCVGGGGGGLSYVEGSYFMGGGAGGGLGWKRISLDDGTYSIDLSEGFILSLCFAIENNLPTEPIVLNGCEVLRGHRVLLGLTMLHNNLEQSYSEESGYDIEVKDNNIIGGVSLRTKPYPFINILEDEVLSNLTLAFTRVDDLIALNKDLVDNYLNEI